jgi:hypothetical protein
MIFSPLFVPNIKLKRSPGASLKFSSGTNGIESYLNSSPFGILNKMLLLMFRHELITRVATILRMKNRFRIVIELNPLEDSGKMLPCFSQVFGSCIFDVRSAILSFSFLGEVRHFLLIILVSIQIRFYYYAE